jgi:photosystem II stability/assembly factor-like uncharacterized protein
MTTGIISFAPPGATGWNTLKLGAGGYITGLDFSPDGTTRLAHADAGGAYIWDVAADEWKQLLTSNRGTFTFFAGVWDVRCAPSLPTTIYMAVGGDDSTKGGDLYKSTDRGVSFTKLTGWTSRPNMNASNGAKRFYNPKLAVDPIDPNHVLIHTMSHGMYRTTNGGTTWVATSLPTGTNAGVVCFDAGSTAVSGRTGTIYAATGGNAVYKSTDGGATWAAIAGSPVEATGYFAMCVATNHVLYVMGDGYSPPYTAALYRLVGSTWTTITPSANQWDALASDPNNSARLLYAFAGTIRVSLNANTTATWNSVPTPTRDSTGDVPWLSWTEESYMASAGFVFDPVLPDRVWFAQGIGVWYADIGSGTPSSLVWHSQGRGIEELVVNQIVKIPSGGPILVAVWDRQLFRQYTPDTYPTRHYPNNTFGACWSLASLASNPNFIVVLDQWGGDLSYKSTDAGATATTMPALGPAMIAAGGAGGSYYGGHIAVASTTNFVYVPGADAFLPLYTKDGGTTWTAITLPAPSPGAAGWSIAQYAKRHICDADTVTANKFYLYNYTKGLYVSSNSGDTWTLVNPNIDLGALGSAATAFSAKLRNIPGKAGELIFTSGADGQAPPFIRSANGGVAWSVINASMQNVFAFGFGKTAAGQSYPAIFVYGQYSGTYGYYRSDDNGASWINIFDTTYWLDPPTTIEGDPDVFGRFYVGHGGTGCRYYTVP